MKLEAFLEKRGVDFNRHHHPITYTSQSLATVEHVTGYIVAKPVIVKGQTDYAMCVLAAPWHVDLRRAARALGEPEVRLATEKEMTQLFPDCELGAEPPIGSMFGLKTVMDNQLAEDQDLVMQAGTHTESVRMSRAEWQRLCNPIVADIARN